MTFALSIDRTAGRMVLVAATNNARPIEVPSGIAKPRKRIECIFQW